MGSLCYSSYFLKCMLKCCFNTFECDEIFRVGLTVVEHHKHVGVLLIINQAIEADIRLLRRHRWRNLHVFLTQCVQACEDSSNKHELSAVFFRAGEGGVSRVAGIYGKVGTQAISSSWKERNGSAKDEERTNVPSTT